jgi:hypothetical protein
MTHDGVAFPLGRMPLGNWVYPDALCLRRPPLHATTDSTVGRAPATGHADPVERAMEERTTMPFDTFWAWLTQHPDCIVRAGTPEAVLFDDDDLHWLFSHDEDGPLVVQLVRGKRLIGEILIEAQQVAYVELGIAESPEEHVFDLIAETERERFAPYFFVMAHGFEEGEAEPSRNIH